MKTIKIDRDYYCEDVVLFKKENIVIKPGFTALVGCNGSGKTTLLNHLEYTVKNDKSAVIMFNNLTDGGNNARDEALNFLNDMTLLATLATSSEGENIVINFGRFATKLGKFIKKNTDKDEIWILLDAVDSGLSIDNILEFKNLFNLVIEDNKNRKVYIIAAVNTYEFARGEQCLDVYNGKYITFKDYEEYREFVINSAEIKRKRYKGAE